MPFVPISTTPTNVTPVKKNTGFTPLGAATPSPYVAPTISIGQIPGKTLNTQTQQEVRQALSTPTQPQNFFTNIQNSFNSAVEQVNKNADTFVSSQSTPLQKGVAVADTAIQAVNVLFSPISSALNSATAIPVVGKVADGFNRVFSAIGAGAAGMARDTIQALPLDQGTKDTITPLAQEVAALVAQVKLGKATAEITPRLKTAATELTSKVRDIVTSHADIATRPTPSFTRLTSEPTQIKPTEAPVQEAPTAPVVPESKIAPPTNPASQKAISTQLQPKETSPIQVPNTRAQTLQKASLERKIINSLEENPTHTRIDMTEQGKRALEFIQQNPEEALKVAKGEVVSPSGVLAESIYTAQEIKALQEGDVATLRELTKSTVPTAAGQSLKALDSTHPDSPVAIMREVQRIREEALVKKGGVKSVKSNEVKAIKSEIQKSRSARPTWEEFIKEIQCNY